MGETNRKDVHGENECEGSGTIEKRLQFVWKLAVCIIGVLSGQ
jgi:hypothetical protein